MTAPLQVSVRPERSADAAAVREVNEQAFAGPVEADIVDALRARRAATLSLVAESAGGSIVGHALFTPVDVVCDDERVAAVALGPMAVLPRVQRRGIGGELLRRGLALLCEQGHDLVVVLGHPEYYPRFGFAPASRLGLRCQYDVPDEVFMAQELRPGAWSGSEGLVRYQPEFDAV